MGAWGGKPVIVGKGGTSIALFPANTSDPNPPPEFDTLAVHHFAFRVSRATFEQAAASFTQHDITFRFVDHEHYQSIYLADPDGHRVELVVYEPA